MKISIILVANLLCIAAYSQSESRFDYINTFGGVNYSNRSSAYLGLSITKNSDLDILQKAHFSGYLMEAGCNWGERPYGYVAVGYENNPLGILILRSQLAIHSDFPRTEMSIKPEIGISVLGFVNIMFGHTFVLSTNDVCGIKGSSLGINCHFPIISLKRKKNGP